MKKTGIALMILGNILHICSGMEMKITKTTADNDDPEINKEVEKEISCPKWLGISFVIAGGMLYLANVRK
jgi:hypothetical protein